MTSNATPRTRRNGMKSNLLTTTLLAVALLAVSAQAETLLWEPFDGTASTLLENAGLGWTKVSSGGSAALWTPNIDGQALANSAGATWENLTYEKSVNRTLGLGETFQVTYVSSLWPGSSSDNFYDSHVRLINGSDYAQIRSEGGSGGLTQGKTSLSSVDSNTSGASYVMDPPPGGSAKKVAYLRMLTDASSSSFYTSDDRGVTWTQVGTTLTGGLDEIDTVQLNLYTPSYWGVMDSIRVSVIPEPATMGLLGLGGLGMLLRRRSRKRN